MKQMLSNKMMTPTDATNNPAQCPTCHGKKTVPVVTKGVNGTVTKELPCPLCKGSGVGKYATK